jgi:hypothetical protein
MSPTNALFALTWAAIVVLFLGLAAVLREVRLLRGEVSRDADGFSRGRLDLSLGGSFAAGAASAGGAGGGDPGGNGGTGTRIVLAADSGCPLCVAVAERLRRLADAAPSSDGPAGAVLLTHEPAAAWNGMTGGLRIVSDPEAWRAVAHLSPPVLMLVDGAGRVRRLVLPVREQEVDDVWRAWRDSVTTEEDSGGIDARADS